MKTRIMIMYLLPDTEEVIAGVSVLKTVICQGCQPIPRRSVRPYDETDPVPLNTDVLSYYKNVGSSCTILHMEEEEKKA